MKIDNYAFVRVWWSNHKVAMLTTEKDNSENPEDSLYYVALLGEGYGREGFKDGEHLHTSAIKEFTDDGKVVTYSGSVYELGNKNPGYIAYERAVAEGLRVIQRWAIGSIGDDGEVYLEGEIGNSDGEYFRKQIVAQDGAVLTVVDGTKVFVDWVYINAIQLRRMRTENRRGTLKGEKFCCMAFEPDVFANNWKSAGGTSSLSKEDAVEEGIS